MSCTRTRPSPLTVPRVPRVPASSLYSLRVRSSACFLRLLHTSPRRSGSTNPPTAPPLAIVSVTTRHAFLSCSLYPFLPTAHPSVSVSLTHAVPLSRCPLALLCCCLQLLAFRYYPSSSSLQHTVYTARPLGRPLLLSHLVVHDEDVDEDDDDDDVDEDEDDEDGAARGAASDNNDLLRQIIPPLLPLILPLSLASNTLAPVLYPPLTRPKALLPQGGLFARLCVRYVAYM
ncbi:hypothetical protein C8Q70DRAFT_4745 [Cubamyces menziesii]|nr:hypothetical protein C8Q70DRAFT_4745 [Cubamyces menziesii]